jgi:hypothetical protein
MAAVGGVKRIAVIITVVSSREKYVAIPLGTCLAVPRDATGQTHQKGQSD